MHDRVCLLFSKVAEKACPAMCSAGLHDDVDHLLDDGLLGWASVSAFEEIRTAQRLGPWNKVAGCRQRSKV
jgi:hypothetical protein